MRTAQALQTSRWLSSGYWQSSTLDRLWGVCLCVWMGIVVTALCVCVLHVYCSRSTARTFYAAGTFFDILNQFGDASDDVRERDDRRAGCW